MINEVIEDLHYIRRYYESHSKATFSRIYRVVVQIFLNFLKKRSNLNETFYIYTSSSPKSSNEYKNDSNIVFIFNQSDICDLFDLTVKTFSFSFSFNFYYREISVKFWKWLITSWIWFSQIFQSQLCWFFERLKRFATTLTFWLKNVKFTKFSNELIFENTSNSKLFQRMSLLSIVFNELKAIIIVELSSEHALKKIYIWTLKIFSQLKKHEKSSSKYAFSKTSML